MVYRPIFHDVFKTDEPILAPGLGRNEPDDSFTNAVAVLQTNRAKRVVGWQRSERS